MRVIIAGAKDIGYMIAKTLREEGHEIVIIEPDPDIARETMEQIDVLVKVGSPTDQKLLKEVGISNCENFIAVSASDEVNIMSCMLAHKMGARTRIAVARNTQLFGHDSALKLDDIGIDFAINPDNIIIDFLLKIVEFDGAVDIANLEDVDTVLYSLRTEKDNPMIGKKIREIKKQLEEEPFWITSIFRDNKLIRPSSDEKLMQGDIAQILVPKGALPMLSGFISKYLKPVKNMTIAGANTISIEFAKKISSHKHIVFIEPDISKAEYASFVLPNILILQGSPAETDILTEADIANSDIYIALTEDEKSNILSAIIAKSYGVKRSIITTSSPEYTKMARLIGICIAINPKFIVADKILNFIGMKKAFSMRRSQATDTCIINFKIAPTSIYVNRKLSSINFGDGVCVGGIFRRHEILQPTPDLSINEDDYIITIAQTSALDHLKRLFSK